MFTTTTVVTWGPRGWPPRASDPARAIASAPVNRPPGPPPPCRQRSSFDVGQLLRDPAGTDTEDVHAADVPVRPGVAPARQCPVAAHEGLLGGEAGVDGVVEEVDPRGAHGLLSF